MPEDDFRTRLCRAFDSVPYPGDRNICQGTSHEERDIRRVLRRKRWQDCDASVLGQLAGPRPISLIFMEPEGFHYYVPAFVVNALDGGSGSYRIATFFDPQSPAWEKEGFSERMRLFSRDQRDVLAEFFLRFSTSPVAKRAAEHMRLPL